MRWGRVETMTDVDVVASWVVLAVCVGYALVAWLVQMYRVAPPRDWLRDRILYLEALIESESWSIHPESRKDLGEIRQDVSTAWILLPVSKVQAGWRNVHALEDDHIPELSAERVEEGLKTAKTRLTAIPGNEAKGFVDRITLALNNRTSDASRAALLREAEIFRHNDSDTKYENLANLLGKAVWLTWIALGMTVALAALFDRESYFLLGAAGGLVSRLTRVLRRLPKALDYGAEWSTLILSPAAGALLGWLGVAIVVALAKEPFNVLGDSFVTLWGDATVPLGLTIAFLFGFSERLMDRLISTAESQFTGKLPKAEETDKESSTDKAGVS
jgi:hypothetical protein